MRFFFVQDMDEKSVRTALEAFKPSRTPRFLSAWNNMSAEDVIRYAGEGIEILLDSGAFEAHTHGKQVSLDEYCKYLDAVGNHVYGYFNLDVIDDPKASKKNYDAMRERGYDPIPVFHYLSDYSYLEYYLDKSEYVGIGGLVKRFKFAGKWLVQTMAKIPKDTRVHLLGTFKMPVLMSGDFFSCDSSYVLRRSVMHDVLGAVKARQRKQSFGRYSQEQSEGLYIHNMRQMLLREQIITDYWEQKNNG